QGHVGVGRVAAEDLQVCLAEAMRKLSRYVAADLFELLKSRGVPLLPALGQPGEMLLALALELPAVAPRALDALVQVCDEAGLEVVVAKLFEQHRRQADGQGRPRLMQRDFADDVEQRQVSLGRRLVQPRLAVRPGAVVQDVGQVPVEDDAQATEVVAHSAAYCSGSRARRPRSFQGTGVKRAPQRASPAGS